MDKDYAAMNQVEFGSDRPFVTDSVAGGLAVDRVLEIIAAFAVITSLIGLVAALAGVFHAPQVVLGSLIATGIYWLKTRGRGMFPASVRPRWQHIVLLVLVALFFRLPVYHYILGGQDEGLYTNIAQHIDYTAGLDAHDQVMQKLEGTPYLQRYLDDNRILEGDSPTLYLLGVYARQPGTTHLVFQFYYLFPVWMALVGGLFGSTAAVYALTFFALLSIIFFYRIALLLTRSHRAALLAGGLLALNPLHAFFSKFPVTEMPTLAFSLIGFTLLASYWSTEIQVRRARWLWLSVLSFLCLFATRISGLMYMPFVAAVAMAALVCDEDMSRRKAIQWWAIGVVVAYFASVVYGLHWSRYYSRDQYITSLRPLFGAPWRSIVESIIVLGILAWVGCWVWARQRERRDHLASWLVRPINRWLGLTVAVAVVICLVRMYWLGWTSHYELLGARFHLSGKEWGSASASSLWTLFIFLGPFMMLGFFATVGRRRIDPRIGLLRLFVIEFFIYAIVVQWITFYSPYYARYLLSEVVPYLMLFVVCAWQIMRLGRARKLLSVALMLSLVYSAAISAMQIGKNEDDGAHASLARLIAPVDPDDVILLDTLNQAPNTNLVKTPLVYTFHRDVVTVGSEALSDKGYVAELGSLYGDVFLISSNPFAPAGYTQLDSVRFRPLTYEHNHSFPHKLVPQEDVVLYLYRLDSPQIPLGHALSFVSGQVWGDWLQSGWSRPEPWGVWSDTTHAVLAINPSQLPADSSELLLHFKTVVFVTPRHPRQRIAVSLNGVHVADYQATYPATSLSMTIPVPSTQNNARRLLVEFTLPDAASPKSVGTSGDARQLALGLVSMTVTEAGSVAPAAVHK
ncbi:MAG TPA: hypothetical protein VJ833_11645 [Rhodanobacteraceae bacterium]|nr:hypothetical protein [Rhodanobacteraceae bacterium]